MSSVSVIIPAYNSSLFISETIESVLSQTYKAIEIIVVDDGSTDDTLSIAQSFEPYGVKVFHKLNKGACAARNFGFERSQGEFIQFIDADDPIAPDKIEKQLRQLTSHTNYKQKLIHCRWGRFNSSKDDVYYWGPDASIQKNLKPIEWLVANQMSNTHCWLTHRSLIEKAGLWNESLRRNQDGEFFSRLIAHADEILYCDEAKVYYRSGNTGSISNTISRPAMESLLMSLQLIEKTLFSLEISLRTKLTLANKYQDFVYCNFITNPDLAALAEKKVIELGGSELKLPGGIILRCLSGLFGWKNALTIKKRMFRGAKV